MDCRVTHSKCPEDFVSSVHFTLFPFCLLDSSSNGEWLRRCRIFVAVERTYQAPHWRKNFGNPPSHSRERIAPNFQVVSTYQVYSRIQTHRTTTTTSSARVAIEPWCLSITPKEIRQSHNIIYVSTQSEKLPGPEWDLPIRVRVPNCEWASLASFVRVLYRILTCPS